MCNTRGVSGVSGVGCALFFFGGVLSVREGCAFSIIPTVLVDACAILVCPILSKFGVRRVCVSGIFLTLYGRP